MKTIISMILSTILVVIFGIIGSIASAAFIYILEQAFNIDMFYSLYMFFFLIFGLIFFFLIYPFIKSVELRIDRLLGLKFRTFIVGFKHSFGKTIAHGNYIIEARYPSLSYFNQVIQDKLQTDENISVGDIMVTYIYELSGNDIDSYKKSFEEE